MGRESGGYRDNLKGNDRTGMIQQDNERKSIADRVRAIADPLCAAENFELVNVECLAAHRAMVIRLSMDKPGGITIDDCVYMTRQLGDLIDVHLDDLDSYRLEVASPGPNRPLTKDADFQRFKGKKVRIELYEPLDGRKRFTGILKGLSNGVVELTVDQKTVGIQYDTISKAKLAGVYGE